MSKNYDNWERLMGAVLRRERDRQIALNHSYSSVSSTSSTSNDLTSSLFDHDDHSLVNAKHRNQLPADYSNSTIDHTCWKKLPPLPLPLPPGKQEAVWKSASMSFSPDQRTGKNCLMLGPTRLGTSSGEQFEHYWKIKSDHESRFSEVAELRDSSVFFIKGMIKARMLSPETFYAASLIQIN
ncbi:hypothetical protein BUALT_Bualt14G0041700 [Buddleja alternifolia]|uniref:Uncharacterized protein n=1 Tax=Buddleja alternifolia TaxID=168488 RepID=A0AAV6WRV9_9LAMI|nr:hypothetical protein BUALT_Bualt14G0041700 [Buddleja alternifolia]